MKTIETINIIFAAIAFKRLNLDFHV